MDDIPSSRAEHVVGCTTRDRQRAREKAPSAQTFEDWIDVLFQSVHRGVLGLIPYAVLAFAAVEFLNPDLLGEHHISADFAQILVGGALGNLGMAILTEKASKR
jgi:hypothetical protein